MPIWERIPVIAASSEHNTISFTVNFFADAFICAMGRWLAEPDSLPPEEFVARTKYLIQNGAAAIYEETESEEEAGEKTEKEKM